MEQFHVVCIDGVRYLTVLDLSHHDDRLGFKRVVSYLGVCNV